VSEDKFVSSESFPKKSPENTKDRNETKVMEDGKTVIKRLLTEKMEQSAPKTKERKKLDRVDNSDRVKLKRPNVVVEPRIK